MKTVIGKQYCVTCDSACDIVDTATGNTIHTHHEGEAQSYFTAIGIDSEPSDNTAVVTEVFKSAPAGNGGGGYIESNLNVGHGASSAVAAQCTLTPGADLDIGGTLEHDGSVVELENQFAELDMAVGHPEYGGKLKVTDTDGQTLYIFDVPAAFGDFASIALTLAEGWEMDGIEFALVKGDGDTLELAYSWEGEFLLSDFADFLNSGAEGSLGDFAEAQTWGPGIKITLKDPAFAGTAGNAVSYASRAMSPFTNEDGETFSGGGENARDILGLVEAMQDDDAPVEVEVNSGNNGVLLTSKVGGAAGACNVVNAEGGDLWLGVDDMIVIANPRTLEDLANAITDDAAQMQLASASVSDGKIVLTAPTTPTATQYNNMEYTATGCFGSGTVKQGSTTRGKNAVTQTAFKIYLNGEELFGESTVVVDVVEANNANAVTSNAVFNAIQAAAPHAPTPEPLEEDTAMKHGGVYTVEADIDARTVTLAEHATAAIIVSSEDGPIPNVQLPAWKWCTEDGLLPEFDYFRVYHVDVQDDGFHTSARLVSQYATEREWLYTKMSTQTATTGDIVYVQAETHTFANNIGNRWFDRDGTAPGGALTGTDNISLAGTEWTIAETRGSYTFDRSATFKLAAPKKFSHMTCWAKVSGYYPYFLLQAWDADAVEWVDAADVVDVRTDGQIDEVIVNVYPGAPRTDKWRILSHGNSAARGVAFTHTRFFETL